MFFVVDVETSGLTPWSGQLLTIGIQAVSQEGELVGNVFYRRLKHTAPHPLRMKAIGYKLTPTYEFWADQDSDVMDEAYSYKPGSATRISHKDLVADIATYLDEIEPDKSKRFIAANPVAFDKMWLEYVYGEDYDRNWPFHYRCLCLRSLRFGLEPETTFGSSSGNQKSEIPHHAYYDVLAEALDLIDLINLKRDTHYHLDEFWKLNKEIVNG